MGTCSHQRSILVCTTAMFIFGGSAGAAQPAATPKFSTAVAFDVSRPVRELAPPSLARRTLTEEIREVRPDRGPVTTDRGFGGDHAIQRSADGRSGLVSALLAPPLLTFEGLSNNDNFALYGGRVNPPDPVGDIGPNHYVEMVNLAFAVYDRSGNALTGPTRIGDLWSGFAIADCTDPSGDPIVVYDQLRNRWLLSCELPPARLRLGQLTHSGDVAHAACPGLPVLCSHRQASRGSRTAPPAQRNSGGLPARRRCAHFANSFEGSLNALNSSALPEGSSRNIVACSPTSPRKRMPGSMTKLTPTSRRRAARACHACQSSTTPKCGTGTAFPSTRLKCSGCRLASRCATS